MEKSENTASKGADLSYGETQWDLNFKKPLEGCNVSPDNPGCQLVPIEYKI